MINTAGASNKTGVVVFLLLASCAVSGLYYSWIFLEFTHPFKQVKRNDSESRVIALLGRPQRVTATHDVLKETWNRDDSFGDSDREIVKEFSYQVPVVYGREYVIGFDVDGRVVFKSRLTSP